MTDATTCPTAAPQAEAPPAARITGAEPETAAVTSARAAGARRPLRRRRATAVAEAVVGLVTGVGFLLWARSVDVNPLVRIGQVSGLAGLQLHAAVVGAPLLYQLVRFGATTKDRYAMITVYADPAYVLGWASDRAGTQTYHDWPVGGELAGQSAFTLLLLAAAALAIGLGSGGVLVRTVATVLVSSWLLRFWFAAQMERTQAVQLYPRTTWIIMYCLIVLAVLGLMLAVRRTAAWSRRLSRPSGGPATGQNLLAVRRITAAGVCAIALFTAMAGSWSANRYMPTTASGVLDMGLDAWRAHVLKDATGQCPRYSPVATCAGVNQDLTARRETSDDPALWCSGVPSAEWPVTCGRRAPWA
ncbi:hypothetical protein [Kitasatospora sp. NPDC059827]|uniref:hypothetical protein n=1 Tax=Kitasatospora sp. NPDC059827 TaxID=3346964 RepID=UPI00365CA7D4